MGKPVAEAYASADVGDWKAFSQKVYVAASHRWASAELDDDVRLALTKLQFTEETFGRQWALLERIFHTNTGLLTWDELSPPELDALQALGWSASGMAMQNGTHRVRESSAAVDWDNADSPLPECLVDTKTKMIKSSGAVKACTAGQDTNAAMWSKLFGARITQAHWDRLQDARVRTPGCFWHAGLRAATDHTYTSGFGSSAATASRRRREDSAARSRRAAQHTPPTRAVMCGEGLYSKPFANYTCAPCPSGTYKTAGMQTRSRCADKPTSCASNSKHRLFTAEQRFVAESTTKDDTICIEDGLCPAGTQKTGLAESYTCAACPGGKFNKGPSHSIAACMPKTLIGCAAGQYWRQGPSLSHDDNTCLNCPEGSFQNATVDCADPTKCTTSAETRGGTICLPKSRPAACDKGTFLALGQNTAEDDNACSTCPAGQYSPKPHLGTACLAKQITKCPAGQFLLTRRVHPCFGNATAQWCACACALCALTT